MLPIVAPYETLDDAIASLTLLEQQFRDQHDRRAVFATAYLEITRAINRGVEAARFQDHVWVSRYAVCFANLYRQALLAYEHGDLASVPKAWRIAFEAARNGRTLIIQDLILGINAHVNYDLALALIAVSIDPERAARYADHTKVNEILQAATDLMQQRVGRLYAPILNALDLASCRLDEEIASFSVAKARESAWVSAVALANARDDLERVAIRAGLNDRTAVLARLVLAPTAAHPWLVGALRHLEHITPWTQLVAPLC